jgi:stress response protein YsnF
MSGAAMNDRTTIAENALSECFADKIIEMTETAEQIVVSKATYVREEIILRRHAADRTATVHGTLRSEQVEVTRLAGDEIAVPETT